MLAKKRRAMRRWRNAALYLGLCGWVEHMRAEGPWWEPDEVERERGGGGGAEEKGERWEPDEVLLPRMRMRARTQ